MIQDLHSHTYYSYCGKDSPEAVIKNAIEKGIGLVGISDHYYGIVMNKPGFVYEDAHEKARMHRDALLRYREHIGLLAEKYKDYIQVWCGVEINTSAADYTLMAEGVDAADFDYCLIENLQAANSVEPDLFGFAARCGCKRTGIAHMDLPAYIASKGLDITEYFRKMAQQHIFWELNVNYDSIHGYREHGYVKDFFADARLLELVRSTGVHISVGFDGHRLEDYDAARVKDACHRLEQLSISLPNDRFGNDISKKTAHSEVYDI